jgi:hypothetical protein
MGLPWKIQVKKAGAETARRRTGSKVRIKIWGKPDG